MQRKTVRAIDKSVRRNVEVDNHVVLVDPQFSKLFVVDLYRPFLLHILLSKAECRGRLVVASVKFQLKSIPFGGLWEISPLPLGTIPQMMQAIREKDSLSQGTLRENESDQYDQQGSGSRHMQILVVVYLKCFGVAFDNSQMTDAVAVIMLSVHPRRQLTRHDGVQMMKFRQLVCIASYVLAIGAISEAGESRPLFNGKTLDGWTQKGGVANYRVEDGVIVGESVPDTPNSFLCTEQIYGDFVLEYEYKCDNRLNSGVQIRSNVFDRDTQVKVGDKTRAIPAGRVHGYQVEIDPNKPERMWSGGIYDEGRRGWLFPGIGGGNAEAFTAQGKKAFKPDQWNKVRVECNGNSIRTWLNDEPRANLIDTMTFEGIIALQVHGIGNHKEAIGTTVQWRNLTIRKLK